MAENEVRYDLDSYDIITQALMELINQYPALDDDDEITFAVLEDTTGKAMVPVSGGIILKETEDVTSHIYQECLYPFNVYYRASGLSEKKKMIAKEWLDNLGRWLERQVTVINGNEYQLTEYPTLNGDREFLNIYRSTPSFPNDTNEDKVEDRCISISALYRNEYDRF